MDGFLAILKIVVTMLVFLSFGFMLVKFKKGDASHAKTLSAILVYILSPAMIINSFLNIEFTPEGFGKISLFFLASLLIQIVFFIIMYLIFRKKFEDAKYRILTVSSVLGNVGFFGLPAIQSLFPNEAIVLCYSSIYVLSMNLLVFTVGIFLITNDKSFISIKSALLNPTTLSLVVALPLYFFNVKFPQYVMDPLGLLAKMVTPVCMFILGMRLATIDLKGLFTRPFVYISCLLKLVIYPLFAYLCVLFIPGLDPVFKVSIFVLSAAPSGAIIVSLAELHGCEQELSANVVLMTTLFSVITMPLLMLIVAI